MKQTFVCCTGIVLPKNPSGKCFRRSMTKTYILLTVRIYGLLDWNREKVTRTRLGFWLAEEGNMDRNTKSKEQKRKKQHQANAK